jgi:hypothetical protein
VTENYVTDHLPPRSQRNKSVEWTHFSSHLSISFFFICFIFHLLYYFLLILQSTSVTHPWMSTESNCGQIYHHHEYFIILFCWTPLSSSDASCTPPYYTPLHCSSHVPSNPPCRT